MSFSRFVPAVLSAFLYLQVVLYYILLFCAYTSLYELVRAVYLISCNSIYIVIIVCIYNDPMRGPYKPIERVLYVYSIYMPVIYTSFVICRLCSLYAYIHFIFYVYSGSYLYNVLYMYISWFFYIIRVYFILYSLFYAMCVYSILFLLLYIYITYLYIISLFFLCIDVFLYCFTCFIYG